MPALKRQPAITTLQAVTNASSFRHRMMSIHNGRDARQRRRTQFTKQAVDICGNEVEVKVGVHFSEVRRLNVAPPKLGLRERDTAFQDLRRALGRSIPVDLIDPSAPPSGLEYEIAIHIRDRIANRYDATSISRPERLTNFSTISHSHILSQKATAAFAACVQPRQRHPASDHAPHERAAAVGNP